MTGVLKKKLAALCLSAEINKIDLIYCPLKYTFRIKKLALAHTFLQIYPNKWHHYNFLSNIYTTSGFKYYKEKFKATVVGIYIDPHPPVASTTYNYYSSCSGRNHVKFITNKDIFVLYLVIKKTHCC